MLHLTVWEGQDFDWVTLTPQNPEEFDSSEFDQGKCTGFLVKNNYTDEFVAGLRALAAKTETVIR